MSSDRDKKGTRRDHELSSGAAGAPDYDENGVDRTLIREFLDLDPPGLAPTESHLSGPGHNLLDTTCGRLDLLGSIGDGLDYEDLVKDAVTVELEGLRIAVLGLERLIAIRESIGCPKDLAVLPTLRATLDEIRKRRA